ncbi:MAG: hypothetical protein ACUVTQ_08175 [Desulfotomaculales bacterium]
MRRGIKRQLLYGYNKQQVQALIEEYEGKVRDLLQENQRQAERIAELERLLSEERARSAEPPGDLWRERVLELERRVAELEAEVQGYREGVRRVRELLAGHGPMEGNSVAG